MFGFLFLFVVSASSVSLAWDPSSSAAWITNYKLYEKTGDQTEFIYRLSVPSTQTTVTFEIKPAQRYSWHVTAAKDLIESDPSNQLDYFLKPTFKISQHRDGPNVVMTMVSDVYRGMVYEVMGSEDLINWAPVHSGVAGSDLLTIMFNTTEPHLFFQLREKGLSLTAAGKTGADFIPLKKGLSYSPASRWQKLKHFLRYRPGMHPKDRFSNQEPVVRKFKLPPLPSELRMLQE